MIRTFEKWKEVRLFILSPRLQAIPYHWFGRSIMCAGEDCPACSTRSPRRNYYFGAMVRTGKYESVTDSPPQREVCEVPESAALAITGAWEDLGGGSAYGMSLSLERKNTRDVWSIVGACRRQLDFREMAIAELISQVAIMYRLPGPKEHEDFLTWLARVRVTQGPALASRCLFS